MESQTRDYSHRVSGPNYIAATSGTAAMTLDDMAPAANLPVVVTRPLPAKRIFDFCFAAAVLLFIAPLLFIITVALLIADGRPIFFKQKRIGKGGREFHCLKFRSMVKDADVQLKRVLESSEASRREWAETHKLKNDPRIHVVGRILRKTSLDELPQFINVLKGEMSVVGPRPIVRQEVPRYGDHISYYYAATPGVTGLWQVSGRNSVSYAERVALDVAYVSDPSPMKDFTIIAKTVGIVLTGSGDH